MKRCLIVLGAWACALPAVSPAQHAGHAPPPEPGFVVPGDAHAGQGEAAQESQPTTAEDPHAAHAPTPEARDDTYAGHAKETAGADAPPLSPPPPRAWQGPEHAATTVFDAALFERKRLQKLIAEHGGYVTGTVLADRLEYRAQDGDDGYRWDAQAWYGGDFDKLWIKTEGEGEFSERAGQAEIQALYSRAIGPWFDLQAGVRHDFRPEPERVHLVLGLQGLAPYWFEIDAALFLAEAGDLTARIEAEYDQRITQKLILQPTVELDFSADDVPEIGLGSGLSSLEAGIRVRYEFVPEFAPYLGVEYERSFGGTADFAREAGENADGWSVVLGVRSWF